MNDLMKSRWDKTSERFKQLTEQDHADIKTFVEGSDIRKTANILPCMHIWEFKQGSYYDDAFEDYFECSHCHKQRFYCPEDLEDVEYGQ